MKIYFQRFSDWSDITNSRFSQGNLNLLRSEEVGNQLSLFYMTAVLLNDPYYSGLKKTIDEVIQLIDQELHTYIK